MSYEIRARIFQARDLTTTEKAVLMALEFHLNLKTGQCNPSNETLMVYASLSKQGLHDVLNRLEAKGSVAIERKRGRSNSNNYTLFPQEELAAETGDLEEIKGQVETLKGQASRPFEEREKVKLTPIKGQVGGLKGQVDTITYKAEQYRTVENSNTTAVVENSAPPPPKSTLLKSAIGQAVFEINGRYPNLVNQRDISELENLAELVKEFPSEESAAAEIVRRFAFWDKPTPPQLSQIVSQWHVMARIEQRQKDNQNANTIPQTANEQRLRAHIAGRLEKRDTGPPDASLARLSQRR